MSTILMYHYLGDAPPGHDHAALWVPVGEFSGQLAALRAMGRETVLGPEYSERLAEGTLARCVWLTFDDGRLDNLELGLPLLKEAGARATFFVSVEACLGGRTGFIPLSGLRDLLAEGMEIGSHTLTHPRLSRLAPEDLAKELRDSRQRLEDALGVEIRSFCYPYGDQNASVRSAVKEAGYALATGTRRDNRNGEKDRWALSRAMVQPGRTGWRFRYLFSPLYHWVHHRKNRRRWRD